MANGKATLAELRKEAKRVGIPIRDTGRWFEGDGKYSLHLGAIRVTHEDECECGRLAITLLRALPDGALKEG